MIGDSQRRDEIREAFRPNTPVDTYELFAGRQSEISAIMDTISDLGAHIILYGERGVGKTSLARIVQVIFPPNRNHVFVSVNCDRNENFTALWKRVLRQINYTAPKYSRKIQFANNDEPSEWKIQHTLGDDYVQDRILISPDDLRILFGGVKQPFVIILDEFNVIEDEKVRGLVADTIKAFSDYSVPTTLFVVGVADSVDELISDHRSIERAVRQVHMERMKPKDLNEALQKCLDIAHVRATDEAANAIVRLSLGLPHYTHLLGREAALIAFSNGRDLIVGNDILTAIENAINYAQRSIISAYDTATRSFRDKTLHPQVLLACALAERDEMGYFTATEVKQRLYEITHRSHEVATFARHLTDFSSSKRGDILQRRGKPQSYQYRKSSNRAIHTHAWRSR